MIRPPIGTPVSRNLRKPEGREVVIGPGFALAFAFALAVWLIAAAAGFAEFVGTMVPTPYTYVAAHDAIGT